MDRNSKGTQFVQTKNFVNKQINEINFAQFEYVQSLYVRAISQHLYCKYNIVKTILVQYYSIYIVSTI